MKSVRIVYSILVIVLLAFTPSTFGSNKLAAQADVTAKLDELKVTDCDDRRALSSILIGKTEAEAEGLVAQYQKFTAAGLKRDQAITATLMAMAAAKDASLAARQDEAEKKFLGIDWSMGISASFDLGGESRVESASVVDGIVRVEKESNVSLGIALDAHYFFPIDKQNHTHARIGVGPFLAIQTSGNNLIDSWALGVMAGFRHDPTRSTSFNLGLGLRVEPGVKTLGDGIRENEPLPDGETEVRYKEQDRTGIVVLFSASF